MIVPVQHISLSDNNPCTSALAVHNYTLCPKIFILRPYVSMGKNRSLVCTFVICFSDGNESRGGYRLAVEAQNLIQQKKLAQFSTQLRFSQIMHT